MPRFFHLYFIIKFNTTEVKTKTAISGFLSAICRLRQCLPSAILGSFFKTSRAIVATIVVTAVIAAVIGTAAHFASFTAAHAPCKVKAVTTALVAAVIAMAAALAAIYSAAAQKVKWIRTKHLYISFVSG